MVTLSSTLNQFKAHRVMLIGDFVLDQYTIGSAQRISPEAPVPVLTVKEQRAQPGCAGNVILNLLSLGSEVFAIGRLGADAAGNTLREILAKEGAHTDGLFTEEGFITPVKNRIIADGQQMIRVDHEKITPFPIKLHKDVMAYMQKHIEQMDAIAISDYAKGFFSQDLLHSIFTLANKHQVPCIVDPKGHDFSIYKGAWLVKPNLKEAIIAAKLPPEATIEELGKELLKVTAAQHLLVTRSADGISLLSNDSSHQVYPVNVREVKDVTGAGDTVLATLTACTACGIDIGQSIELANLAAGLAVEHMGCSRISLADLAGILLRKDSSNKIFDSEHLTILSHIHSEWPFTVLSISKQEAFSATLFKAIRELSSQRNSKLMVYIKDGTTQDPLISVLSSLVEVDFIVLDQKNLNKLCSLMEPCKAFSLSDGELLPFTQVL